jgi:OFA family oxalate/formate antiporter-like MFS transporter
MSKHRTMTLISGALILFCLGIIYIWSIFNKPVSAYFSGSDVSYTFNIMLVTFVAGILIGGRFQDKKGPRIVVLIGGILFAAGILISSVIPASIPGLFPVFYGGLAGFGVGMAYTSALSCIQKWFPDRRGLASGVLVSAFGVSTVAFGPLASNMLNSLNLSINNTLQILAIIFFAVVIVFVWFIKNPPEGYMADFKPKSKAVSSTTEQFSPSETLRTWQMYFIILCMAMLTLSYFILIPKVTALSQTVKNFADYAVLTVSLSGVASVAGRLVMPILSDYKGRKFAFMILFIVILASMASLIFVTGPLCIVFIWAVAFCYGASAGVFPALTADYFGSKNMGANYGIVMIGFAGAAVLAGSIASNFVSAESVSNFAFIIPVIACSIGIVLMAALKPPVKKAK